MGGRDSVRKFICWGNTLIEKAGYRISTVLICFRRRDTITCLHTDRAISKKGDLVVQEQEGIINESRF